MNKIVVACVAAIIFGTGFHLLGYIRQRVRMKKFWPNVAAQTGLMYLTLVVCMILCTWFLGWAYSRLSSGARPSPFNPELINALGVFIFNRQMLVWGFIGLAVAMMINATFQIGHKLGPGVLWNWITGKYYDPREEELIFMFIDLKDSTGLAERLGPLKFSALVRDFFHDMTPAILESKGSVSHYIGDEAVIYWKLSAGLERARCVKMFFEVQDAIRLKTDSYKASYGRVPEFKAGMHVGPVVATDVGDVKSEIVFHGDTLNTAARIQGLCNEFGEGLLISGDLATKLKMPAGYRLLPLGSKVLKGREQSVELSGVLPC